MKKTILPFLLLALFTADFVLAQDIIVKFESQSDSISESAKSFKYSINYTIEFKDEKPDSLLLEIVTLFEMGAEEGKDYEIHQPNIKLSKDELAGKIISRSFDLGILQDNIEEVEEATIIGIIIKDPNIDVNIPSYKLVIKSEKKEPKFDPENPFRIGIGSNFDLLDGLRSDDLYSDITFRHPTLRKINVECKIPFGIKCDFLDGRDIGLEIGVYQNKSATTEDTLSQSDIRTRIFSIENITGDTATVTFRSIGLKDSYQFNNLGLFVNTTFLRHYDLNGDNKEELSLGFGFYLEAVRREQTSIFRSGETIGIDTTTITRNEDIINTLRTAFPEGEFRDRRFTSINYDRFYGFSIPIYYENKFAEFHFTYSNGWGVFNSRRFIPRSGNNILDGPIFSNMYYITKWKIIEKKVGIQFSGEFRGFYSDDRNNIISLNLSKVFDLTKLLSFN